jgi:asparagine synthase (glutamine-hydrolysing)
MSGIYGFVVRKGISEPAGMLNRMLKAIQFPEPVIGHQWTAEEGHAGLGAVHPARIGEPGHFAQDLSRGVFCVFDGVIYRDADARAENLVEPDGAALLLRRYLDSGTECLAEMNGSFNVAWWDARAHRLVLANDKIGQRLLFLGCRNGAFAFSSLLARVVATGLMSLEIDVEAFADMISFEHTIGERTLFEDIRILPPASVLTYDGNQAAKEKYWHIGSIEPHAKYDEQRLDELEELFRKAVRRSLRPDITVAIDLTGGLDSRCILAAAANMQLPFIAHTAGQFDSTDVVLAQQAAAVVGAEHVFQPIGPEQAAEWLFPMVRYQGGIISTLHSHPCQHFEMPLPFDASVQGIGINYMRGHWVSSAELDIDTLPAAQSFLKRKMSSRTARRMDLEKLWRPEFRTIGLQKPDEHLWGLLDQYGTRDSMAATLDCISFHERCRKFLNKAILIARAVREIYYPYFDHELNVALAKMPVSERVTNRIQVDLIKRFFPKLLEVPSAKTLLPMSASPTRVWMTQRYWAARRRISKQLGLSDSVPVHVPNHCYSRWIRNEMRPTLVELLCNPNAAFRAYLRWDTIETLLDQHFSGKADWEHLVAALTVFEIAHRLWVNSG